MAHHPVQQITWFLIHVHCLVVTRMLQLCCHRKEDDHIILRLVSPKIEVVHATPTIQRVESNGETLKVVVESCLPAFFTLTLILEKPNSLVNTLHDIMNLKK